MMVKELQQLIKATPRIISRAMTKERKSWKKIRRTWFFTSSFFFWLSDADSLSVLLYARPFRSSYVVVQYQQDEMIEEILVIAYRINVCV